MCFLLFLCLLPLRGQSTRGGVPSIAVGGALVLDVSGTVDFHGDSGNKITRIRGTSLREGTTIETSREAKILLRFEDGSEVLLGPQSRLILKPRIQPSGTTLFDLVLGRLRAVVTKRYSGSPSFELGTPTAIVAVRGTRSYLEVNSHEVTEVNVEQGEVQVTSRKDLDDFVLVNPGFSTRVGPEMIPEAPSPTENIRPDVREQQKAASPKDELDAPESRQTTPEPPQQQGPRGSVEPNSPE